MGNDFEQQLKDQTQHPKILLTITSIYALLYTAMVLGYMLFEYTGDEISLEGIITGFAFIIFLIGYYLSWKNELIAGIVFVFWWGIMWFLGLFVAETDKGAGVVMGIPVFILSVFFIHYGYRRRGKTI